MLLIIIVVSLFFINLFFAWAMCNSAKRADKVMEQNRKPQWSGEDLPTYD